MKCFTIAETEIHSGFTLVSSFYTPNEGIGLGTLVALVPSPGLLPEPVVTFPPVGGYIPPNGISPWGIIPRADIFQFQGKPKHLRFNAYVILEQNPQSQDALILWIVNDLGEYNFKTVTREGKVEVYVESSTRYANYWQLLAKMTPNSAVIGTSNRFTVVLSWDGNDLNVTQKSK